MSQLHPVLLAVVIVSVFEFGSGCASIVHGFSGPKMEILSRPGGATVYLDGKELGKTPYTLRKVKGKTREDLFLTLGHHHVRMVPPEDVDAPATNLVMTVSPDPMTTLQTGIGFLGLPGLLVDSLFGTTLNYEPSEWRVDFLEPASAPPPESSGGGATSPPEEPALPERAAGDGPSIDSLLEDIIQQNEK